MTTEQLKKRIRDYTKDQGFVELTIVEGSITKPDKVRVQKYTDAEDAISDFEFESIEHTVFV